MIKKERVAKDNILKFPSKLTDLEKEIEAVIFAAAEPLDIDTIESKEFVEFTKSIWRFPTVSAKRIGHPAPFPVELPRRLIELYSFKGDVIFDPFVGSGSTCIASLNSERKYIGIDIRVW